jgi:threonylcarbamoyladenosine tRNA methylthiotransferase MtaB
LHSVYFKTLGCKLNQAETAILAQKFLDQGYETAESADSADVAVVNTCTVTGRSDAKCRQAVRHILSRNPGTTMIVTGCYSQRAADDIAEIPGVDYILGVREKLNLFQFFHEPGKRAQPQISVSSVEHHSPMTMHAAGGIDRTRAMLKIQTGCDRHCTYCIVPLVRGPGRSMPLSGILKEAKRLVNSGFREIVLTGVHIGAYGQPEGTCGLPALLRSLLSIEALPRIRLTSLEPEHCTDELLEVVRSSSRICRHFHVSIQSGSPSILRAMGRPSDVNAIQKRIERIFRFFPDAGLGADIIVGFPGETESQFEETRQLLLKNAFSYLHIFPYSSRRGTRAADLPDLPARIKSERARLLRELGAHKKQAFQNRWLGKTVEVLLETKNHSGWITGWSSEYLRVGVPFDSRFMNQLVPVHLRTIRNRVVRGSMVNLCKSNTE